MSDVRAPKRDISKVEERHTEYRNYKRGGGFYSTETTTLTLTCGHTKVYRGMYAPTGWARCEKCVLERDRP